MAPSPTFFTAASPKRIESSTTVKLLPEALTSGGSTLIPISRHSAMYLTILSVSAASLVSSAAMYSTG